MSMTTCLSSIRRVFIPNLQKEIEKQTGHRSSRRRRSESQYDYEVYHSLEEVDAKPTVYPPVSPPPLLSAPTRTPCKANKQPLSGTPCHRASPRPRVFTHGGRALLRTLYGFKVFIFTALSALRRLELIRLMEQSQSHTPCGGACSVCLRGWRQTRHADALMPRRCSTSVYSRKTLRTTFSLLCHFLPRKIQSWMFEMNRTQPNLVDMFSIGKSYEGRPLHVLRVRGTHAWRWRLCCWLSETDRTCVLSDRKERSPSEESGVGRLRRPRQRVDRAGLLPVVRERGDLVLLATCNVSLIASHRSVDLPYINDSL